MQTFLKGTIVGGVAAALVLVASSALAGSGIGGVFNLGKVNSVDATSDLKGNAVGPQLRVSNTNASAAALRATAAGGSGVEGVHTTGSGAGVVGINSGSGPGLRASVMAGQPPLEVNSTAKVANLNSDFVQGFPTRTVFVSPVGTASQNGAVLAAKLAGITTASPSKLYLLKVEPGIYRVSSPLQLKPYVDVEGSGKGVTTIEGFYSGSSQSPGAVVATAAHSELRDLTVRNLGETTNSTFNVAVYVGAAGRLRDVVADTATNATGQTSYGIYVEAGATASLDRVTVSARGSVVNAGIDGGSGATLALDSTVTSASSGTFAYGIRMQSSTGTTTIDRSTVSGADGATSEGIDTQEPTVVRNSVVVGATRTVDEGVGGTADVAVTQLSGGAVGGTVVCAGVYDENYAFSANTCP